MLLTFSLHCTDTGKYLGLFTYIELEWAGVLELWRISIFTMPGFIYFNRNILVKCNVDMRLYVFLWTNGLGHRTSVLLERAEVAQPAAVLRDSHVAVDLSFQTGGGGGAVAGVGTHWTLWHAVVSGPTASSGSHVTDDLSLPTRGGGGGVAGGGTEWTLWHTVGPQGTSSSGSHVATKKKQVQTRPKCLRLRKIVFSRFRL